MKNYCKKHKILFMDHIHECPICIGEQMTSIPARQIIKHKKEKSNNDQQNNKKKRQSSLF